LAGHRHGPIYGVDGQVAFMNRVKSAAQQANLFDF
jgi:hypothetical protein